MFIKMKFVNMKRCTYTREQADVVVTLAYVIFVFLEILYLLVSPAEADRLDPPIANIRSLRRDGDWHQFYPRLRAAGTLHRAFRLPRGRKSEGVFFKHCMLSVSRAASGYKASLICGLSILFYSTQTKYIFLVIHICIHHSLLNAKLACEIRSCYYKWHHLN